MAGIDRELGDVEAIKQLKAQYFRLLDTKQWDEWRKLFTDDLRYEGPRGASTGADKFVVATKQWLQPATTVHHGHMPEIVFTSERTARGVWAMFDCVEFPTEDQVGPFPGSRGFVGYGHYEEEYRKENGEWRISLLRLTRLRVNPIVGEPLPPPAGLLPSFGSDWLAGGRRPEATL